MIRWLINLYYARLRRIDMEILWVTCRKTAPTLNQAKAAFTRHCFHDRAWLALDPRQVYLIIDTLE